MVLKFFQKKSYLFILIAITGAVIAFYLNRQLLEYEKNLRNIELENAHDDVIDKFSESLDRFAYLMSGMRSYLRYNDTFPTQQELQQFLIYQVEEVNMKDSLIVSFLNTNHEFVYCFTKDEIDPDHLIGKSVKSFRDDVELANLENLLLYDKMKLLRPINLVEGWVGIPLDFPVMKNGKAIGYIAAILNFRNIVEPIYNLEDSKDFAFSFSVLNEASFDRERVHDGSHVYHDRKDEKYFANYNLDEEKYIYSEVSSYGLSFKIGTAYISEHKQNPYIRWLFMMIYVLLICFTIFSLYRIKIYQKLNSKLSEINKLTNEQNIELQESNATKNRLMSIIGHDLKGPISSIISLIGLVDEDSISLDDTKAILKQLNPVAKNTISLLENLLQWAMVNSDQTLFKPEIINVENIVRENFSLLHSIAVQKNISHSVSIPTNLEVYADYNMISTVIRNLISNALKYSENDTQISISGYEGEGTTILEVTDQGIGMSQKEIDTIKILGLEISKRGTAGEKGTGLGLTLCIAFIKKHEGKLEITSSKGMGSTFKLILPKKSTQ